jgi:polygalacturonase
MRLEKHVLISLSVFKTDVQCRKHPVKIMKIPAALFVLLSGILLYAADAPSAAGSERNVFDVRAFGATGSGTNLDTEAIQKALDACGKAGGGTVRFSPGTYLSQPLTIRTRTTVQIDAGATLLASTNQSNFMTVPGDWLAAKSSSEFIPFIGGKNLTDVTFTGGGVIDGNGSVWWGEAEKARQIKSGYTLPRPNLVVIERSKNLRLENITLQNSPKFHFVPNECEGVIISNVTILAPVGAANTDAIDPSACKNVLITKCKIDVGDDNVAIKSGKKVAGREFASEDITVTDCIFLHGHGVSIGGETAGGVRNVTVKNCTFENTENGLRIKSDVKRGGIVENISYSDITMKNVDPAITFTCYYMNNSAGDAGRGAAAPNSAPVTGQKIPVYRNIRVTNLMATCQRSAGVILGLPESCISNVVFENVILSASTGLTIHNAKGIQFKNSMVRVKSGSAFSAKNAEVEGLPPANNK